MKKRTTLLFIALALAVFFGLVLSACGEEINYGTLTINNLPTVSSAISFGKQEYWGGGVYYDTDFTTYQQFWRGAVEQVNLVAFFDNSISPFNLKDNDPSLTGFSKSGRFLVYIWPVSSGAGEGYDPNSSQYRAYMYVNFTNGKATINFNDMTRESTIPGYQ